MSALEVIDFRVVMSVRTRIILKFCSVYHNMIERVRTIRNDQQHFHREAGKIHMSCITGNSK